MINRPGPPTSQKEQTNQPLIPDIWAHSFQLDKIAWSKMLKIAVMPTPIFDQVNSLWFYAVTDQFHQTQEAFTIVASEQLPSILYTYLLTEKLKLPKYDFRVLLYTEKDHSMLLDKLTILDPTIRDPLVNEPLVVAYILNDYIPFVPLSKLSQKSIELTFNSTLSDSRKLLTNIGMLYCFSILGNVNFDFGNIRLVANPKYHHVEFNPIETGGSRFTQLYTYPYIINTIAKENYENQEQLLSTFTKIENFLNQIIEDIKLLYNETEQIDSFAMIEDYFMSNHKFTLTYSSKLCILYGVARLLSNFQVIGEQSILDMYTYVKSLMHQDLNGALSNAIGKISCEFIKEVQMLINTKLAPIEEELKWILALYPEESGNIISSNTENERIVEIDDTFDIEMPKKAEAKKEEAKKEEVKKEEKNEPGKKQEDKKIEDMSSINMSPESRNPSVSLSPDKLEISNSPIKNSPIVPVPSPKGNKEQLSSSKLNKDQLKSPKSKEPGKQGKSPSNQLTTSKLEELNVNNSSLKSSIIKPNKEEIKQ